MIIHCCFVSQEDWIMLNFVVLKIFGIFAILFFDITAGDSHENFLSNYLSSDEGDNYSGKEIPPYLPEEPSQIPHGGGRPNGGRGRLNGGQSGVSPNGRRGRPNGGQFGRPNYRPPQKAEAKTPAWYNPPRSPYGHYCIGLNRHIKNGDIIFQHYKHFSKVLQLEFLSSVEGGFSN